MISRFYYYRFLLRASISLLPPVAFAVAAYFRFGTFWLPSVSSIDADRYWGLLIFTELVWVIAARQSGLSSVAELFREFTGIKAVALTCFPTLFLQATLLGIVKEFSVSRVFLLAANTSLFVLALLVRKIFRLGSRVGNWPPKREKIVVVGTDQYASRSMRLLHRMPFSHSDVQAYLRLPGQPEVVRDAPIIACSDLARLESLDFEEIVVAIPPQRYLQIASVLESLQDLGKPVRAILDFGARVVVREKLIHFGRMQVMSLALSPTESFTYTIVKRVVDLVGATLGLLLISPLLAAIAVAVKVTSRGPVFFRQERVGRHGRIFTLFKFRTMYCAAARESDRLWTRKDDCRCTPLGTILRRFSLDELPQLFNVIRGEMSLVGPRPERPFFVAKFRKNIDRYNRRHYCQVGITGLAQVKGFRGDTSIPDRLRYDLYYIRNWSLALDLRILLRTISAALRGENAY